MRRSALRLALLMLCMGSGPAARAATLPEVRYTLGGAQSLIYVNNPEQLITSDLGTGPAMNPNAITSDMLSINTPGGGVIIPVTRSDGTGNHPDFGNWAVVYKLRGTLTHTGTYTRNVPFNLQAPDSSCIAD